MREILFQRGPNETGEVEVAEEVAVDDKEGPVAEQVKRLCDSPRGFERLGLAATPKPRPSRSAASIM